MLSHSSHISHSLASVFRNPWGRGDRKIVGDRKKLRTRVKPYLLDTAGPVHSWTWQHSCLHKTWARSSRSPFLLRIGQGLMNFSCSQGTNDIWRLQEAQFSLCVAPGPSTLLQWRSSQPGVYGKHKLDSVGYQKNCMYDIFKLEKH